MNLEQQLKNASNELNKLEEKCTALYEQFNYKDKTLDKYFLDFKSSLQSAHHNIQNPRLSFSVLGTTSAGKSTLVNALLGYEIMPVDIRETSAGICKISFSKDNTFKYRYGKISAESESPEWINEGSIDDLEAFQVKLKTTMKDALEHRKINEQPYFELCIPFLLATKKLRQLLNLPDFVDIEIIDLPGIKNESDHTNLSIIRRMIDKTIPLVVIDYMNLFDEIKRKEILKEVHDLYKILHGNHDALIFLLNKVNLAPAKESFEIHQEGIAKEIQEHLKVDAPIVVKPINALLFSHISALNMDRITPKLKPTQLKNLIECFFDDANTPFRKYIDKNRALRAAFHDLEDILLDANSRSLRKLIRKGTSEPNDIDVSDTFDKILATCAQASFANDFLDHLKKMIDRNKQVLLFHPILSPVRIAFRKFTDNFKASLAILLEENENSLKESLKEIALIQELCEKLLVDSHQQFKEQEKAIEYLRGNPKVKGIKMNSDILEEFFEDCKQIRNEIRSMIISPTVKFLKTPVDEPSIKKAEDVYNKSLRDAISLKNSKSLSRRGGVLKRSFQYEGNEVKKEWILKKDNKDYPENKKEYQNYQARYNLFFTTLREAFSERANRWLDISSLELETKNQELFRSIAEEIQNTINLKLRSLNIKDLPPFNFIDNNLKKVRLKRDLFNLANKDWQYREEKTETETEVYLHTRTCAKDEWRSYSEEVNKTIATIMIPAINDLEILWQKSLREGVENLQVHLAKAMTKSFEQYKIQLSKNIDIQLAYLSVKIEDQIERLKKGKLKKEKELKALRRLINTTYKQYDEVLSSFILVSNSDKKPGIYVL